MLFQVNDAGLQRQMDIVQEELREIRLLQELFTDRLAMCVPNGSAWLQRQEKQIKKRIAFLHLSAANSNFADDYCLSGKRSTRDESASSLHLKRMTYSFPFSN